MAIRRSSLAMIIIGALLIALAMLIKFVAVPYVSKLPEDTNDSSTFDGELRQIDPTTFTLGEATPISIERSATVDEVDGDTAVVTVTAVSKLPTGESIDAHTYAISRVDYSQVDAPSGTDVEDQKGGVTLSFPMDPSTDDALMYDSVTQTAQPVKFVKTSELSGREVHEFSGTTTAPVADPDVLGPLKAGIAAMAQTGDGSTLPKPMIEALLPTVAADRADGVRAALAAAPDQVPLQFTTINSVAVWVDSDFGAPFKNEQDQTTVLNMQVDGKTIPLMDMSQIKVATSDESITTAADKLSKSQTQLNLLGIWAPLGLAIIGVVLIVVGFLRRRPSPAATAAGETNAADRTTTDRHKADR